MTRPLDTAVNETLWMVPERLASLVPERETRQFGNVRACFGHVPTPVVNRIFVFAPASGDDLDAAMRWLGERAVPFQVTTTAPVATDHADDLAALNLEKTRESPGMALSPLDSIPASESSATIAEVTGSDDHEAFRSVFMDAFEATPELAEQLVSPVIVNDDTLTHFVARQGEQPVACGLLVRNGDVAGVFMIGVPPASRRQGLGEAMTWAVLRGGRDAGCTVGVLDSSEMGYPLYEQMGFETVVEYHHFEPATQTDGGETS